MTRPQPIGRERELAVLEDALAAAAAGRTAVVFVEGPTGSGKSTLLAALGDLAAGTHELDRIELVTVLCYETSGANPLGPFGEIMRALTKADRRRTQAKRVLELVRDVAPPLVELIPVIGKLAALGVKAASEAGVYAMGGHEAEQAQLASDLAAALARVADETPLALVIDDAHWIDGPSTEVVARLAQAQDTPLALFVGYDATLAGAQHPLRRREAELALRPHVRTVSLGDLDADAVARLVAERYGEPPHPLLAAWLHDSTDGSPVFLDQYLRTLEESGVLRRDGGAWTLDGSLEGGPGSWKLGGALAAAGTPTTVLNALRPRVDELEEDERELLETGAVQGKRFLSTILVDLLGREERVLLRDLRALSERRRLIASEAAEDWWTDRSALYTFDPGVLQELLYDRYASSPYEAQLEHRAVAEALERLVGADDPPPRHALLEIARHYELGRRPLLAARRLVDAADSTFAEGADRETLALAEHALDLVRGAGLAGLEGDAARDAQRLLARAILLVLLGGEPSWRGGSSPASGQELLALAEEAEGAAAAAGDARLRANARYAKANVLTSHSGLEAGVAAYREARELARAAEDPAAEFAILVRLGHHLDSVDLRQGTEILEEARALLDGGALDRLLDARRLALERARLESSLGVAAFDLGRYGEALDLLTRSARTLREGGQREDAGWAHAFLGQLYTAIGSFEAAEQCLEEGIALFAREPHPLGHRAYLRALLGRLYVEWEPPRLGDAQPELALACAEIEQTDLRPVLPLVRTHRAELLLAQGSDAALLEADELLDETARAAVEFGWARSEIAATSLRARIALQQKRTGDAVELSGHATRVLARHGGAVPAVRSEEILFTHHLVLSEDGAAGACEPLAAAAALVREKARSLPDPAHRQSFLERVRLSAAILEASGLAQAP